MMSRSSRCFPFLALLSFLLCATHLTVCVAATQLSWLSLMARTLTAVHTDAAIDAHTLPVTINCTSLTTPAPEPSHCTHTRAHPHHTPHKTVALAEIDKLPQFRDFLTHTLSLPVNLIIVRPTEREIAISTNRTAEDIQRAIERLKRELLGVIPHNLPLPLSVSLSERVRANIDLYAHTETETHTERHRHTDIVYTKAESYIQRYVELRPGREISVLLSLSLSLTDTHRHTFCEDHTPHNALSHENMTVSRESEHCSVAVALSPQRLFLSLSLQDILSHSHTATQTDTLTHNPFHAVTRSLRRFLSQTLSLAHRTHSHTDTHALASLCSLSDEETEKALLCERDETSDDTENLCVWRLRAQRLSAALSLNARTVKVLRGLSPWQWLYAERETLALFLSVRERIHHLTRHTPLTQDTLSAYSLVALLTDTEVVWQRCVRVRRERAQWQLWFILIAPFWLPLLAPIVKTLRRRNKKSTKTHADTTNESKERANEGTSGDTNKETMSQ